MVALSATLVLILPKGHKIANKFARFWGRGMIAICGSKLEVIGRENLETDTPKIYVANHESHLDIPSVFSSLPIDIYFIAKKELKKVPFLGWYMSAVGMIFIDRGNREKALKSMKEAGEMIKAGKNVFSFPEGTRTKTGKIGMFKRGTFILAIQSDLPIVPMAIKGSRAIWARNQKNITPGKISVSIGKPIHPAADDTPETLADKVKAAVIQLHTQI